MPETTEKNILNDEIYDLESPVVRLKEGLPVSELLNKHQTEFEVTPDDDDGVTESTSPESCFDFADLEKVTNLDLIDVDQEDGEDSTPFDRYRLKMHNLREDGKIMKYLVKQGVGPLVPDNCIVYIRYQAHLEYSELPFDSTLWQCDAKGDLPVSVNLAKGQLLPGLHEGLLSMKKGEKAEFLIHPDLAYGPLGCAPRVPPDATVLFIVEVDRFVDCADALVSNDDLSMEERSQYCNVIKVAKAHYMIGNDLFTKKSFSAAANKYRIVINMMHNARLADDAEEKDRNHFLVKNYTNACVCYHKLSNYKRVCIMASDAMHVNPEEAKKNPKLMYFWGYAKMMLGDFVAAKKHLLSAKNLLPLDQEIVNALKALERRKSEALQQEKLMMKKAFGFYPNKAKIIEINEDEEEFRKKMSLQLNKFFDDPNMDTLTLRDNFTKEEEQTLLQLAKDMGLYARVVDGNKRVLQIKKPADI